MAGDGEGGRRVQRRSDLEAIDAKLRRARRDLAAAEGDKEAESLARLEIDTLLDARFEFVKLPAS